MHPKVIYISFIPTIYQFLQPAPPSEITDNQDGPSTSASSASSTSLAAPSLDMSQLQNAMKMPGSADLQQAVDTVQAMADGQRPELIELISSRMGMTPDQLKAMALNISENQDSIRNSLAMAGLQYSNGTNNHHHHHHHQMTSSDEEAGVPLVSADQEEEGGEYGEEGGSSYVDLYKRAFFQYYADVIWPPIFTFILITLFWAGVLSFWLALFTVPFVFILGVHLVVHKLGGVPKALIPFSRMPAGVVVSLEFVAGSVFLDSMAPMLTDLWLKMALVICLTGVAYYFHYKAITTDPGEIPAKGFVEPLDQDQLAALQAQNPAWCYTCNVYKPIRTKHCQYCGKCRPEFDHHCPTIANCVAEGNRRYFMGYLLVLWVAEMVWMNLAVVFWKRVVAGRHHQHHASAVSFVSVLLEIPFLASQWPGTLYTQFLILLIFSGTTFLALRQLFVVAANLTINEFMVRKRYDYLRDQEGKYSNPFDHGVVKNCIYFWQTERPDWYKIYSERRMGPTGLGWVKMGAGNAWLRQWDDYRATLIRTRMERKRRMENMLLKEGGGVKVVEDSVDEAGGSDV